MRSFLSDLACLGGLRFFQSHVLTPKAALSRPPAKQRPIQQPWPQLQQPARRTRCNNCSARSPRHLSPFSSRWTTRSDCAAYGANGCCGEARSCLCLLPVSSLRRRGYAWALVVNVDVRYLHLHLCGLFVYSWNAFTIVKATPVNKWPVRRRRSVTKGVRQRVKHVLSPDHLAPYGTSHTCSPSPPRILSLVVVPLVDCPI